MYAIDARDCERSEAEFFAYARISIIGFIKSGLCNDGRGKKVKIDGRSVYRKDPVISLETVLGSDGNFTIKDTIEDEKSADPQQAVEPVDFWSLVCRGLNEKRKRCVIMYFLEGNNMPEIAREFGSTRQNISYLIEESCKQIKSRFSRESLQGLSVTA
jgi:DNA-directed RNA polymerase specialized sigma subunit